MQLTDSDLGNQDSNLARKLPWSYIPCGQSGRASSLTFQEIFLENVIIIRIFLSGSNTLDRKSLLIRPQSTLKHVTQTWQVVKWNPQQQLNELRLQMKTLSRDCVWCHVFTLLTPSAPRGASTLVWDEWTGCKSRTRQFSEQERDRRLILHYCFERRKSALPSAGEQVELHVTQSGEFRVDWTS